MNRTNDMDATHPTPQFDTSSVAVLLDFYKENTAHGRHLETQRQLVSGFVMTLGGVALGALASLKFDPGACVVVGFVLVCFGLLGTVFSIVQYGKWTVTRARWRAIRHQINILCKSAEVQKQIDDARRTLKKEHAGWYYASKFPLHWLWTILNAAVLLLGVLLAFEPFDFEKQFLKGLRSPAAIQKVELQQSNPIPVKVQP
jgi:hypothetical protein